MVKDNGLRKIEPEWVTIAVLPSGNLTDKRLARLSEHCASDFCYKTCD